MSHDKSIEHGIEDDRFSHKSTNEGTAEDNKSPMAGIMIKSETS